MGFFRRAAIWALKRALKVDGKHVSGDDGLLFGLGPTRSGLAVTPDTAMALSAVWSAVQLIAESVATLPLPLYRRLSPRGKRRAPEHPAYRLLHDQPNPEMAAVYFRSTMQAHACTRGNAYAEIERSNRGDPLALWGVHPSRVTPKRDANDVLYYEVRNKRGGSRQVAAEDMLHVRGPGGDGIVGESVIRHARETIGLGLATEAFGASFFGNGARPGAMLEHPGNLSEAAQERLKKSIEKQSRGPDSWLKLLILEEGMKFSQIAIPPEDAQFLETRKFQVSEIARWFRVPPHKIGDLEHATFSNIEHQGIEFVVDCLTPWLVRWEQEIHSKLLRGAEREEFFAEHVVAGLLRGDQKARYDSYKIGREGGWLSANDVRELENMNPLPGTQGDIYIVPLNMIPAQQIGKPREGRADVLKARVARAHGRTIADAAGRMIRREAAAVRRAARKDGFRDWLGEFYARHRDIFVRSLEPAALACAEVLAAAWGVDDAQGLERLASDCVGRLVDAHCERARDTLERLAVAAEPEELEAAVARTMAAWEAEGPDHFASDLVDAELKRLAKGAHGD